MTFFIQGVEMELASPLSKPRQVLVPLVHVIRTGVDARSLCPKMLSRIWGKVGYSRKTRCVWGWGGLDSRFMEILFTGDVMISPFQGWRDP